MDYRATGWREVLETRGKDKKSTNQYVESIMWDKNLINDKNVGK